MNHTGKKLNEKWVSTFNHNINIHRGAKGHDSPQCHFREESPSHYFIDCFLYTPEHQALFGLIEHYIPNFPNYSKQKKLDIILNGVNINNDDFISTNVSLTIAVQNFILQTKPSLYLWMPPPLICRKVSGDYS